MVFHDESVRVPLILRRPDGQGAGAVASGLCETTDLMPTLLEVAGCKSEGCFGRSLIPATLNPGAPVHDAVFSEIDHHAGRKTMIRTERHKMVIDAEANTLQLFDLMADPQEMTNLAGRQDARDVETQLREQILRWRLATEWLQR